LKAPVEELIKSPQLLEKVDKSAVSAGSFTLNDILEELKKPGRDPRDKFVAPSFNESVRELSDVMPDMVLEGVVTNVTKFGAFVDIGVHQDGLVHISELSVKFIKDPSEAVKAGQIVKVKVLSADAKTKRIALSIKALYEAGPRGPRQDAPRSQAPAKGQGGPAVKTRVQVNTPTPAAAVKTSVSLDDKLAMLSSKWKGR
jgi:protein Tex